MDGGTGWRHGGEKNGRRGGNGKETTENRFETRRCNRAAKLPGDILDFEKGGCATAATVRMDVNAVQGWFRGGWSGVVSEIIYEIPG